jgi:hypothetical protein
MLQVVNIRTDKLALTVRAQIPPGIGKADAVATIEHPAASHGNRDSLFRFVVELGRQDPLAEFAIGRSMQRPHEETGERFVLIGHITTPALAFSSSREGYGLEPQRCLSEHRWFAMTPSQLHAAIALGSVEFIGAFFAFLPSILPASMKSQAHRICREEGVSQASELHEICLAQTIRALEREDYWIARSFARVTVDAHEACLRVGLRPKTDEFRTCLDNESYAHSLMVPWENRR